MKFIDSHTKDIYRLCTKYKVKRLFAFGSALTDRFTEISDIDFIVDFEPQDIKYYADNYFNLKFALEETFKRQVDLLEEKAIKNPFFIQAIKNKRHLVYGD
jgi:predicted nucleotidyltransferase